MIWRKEQDLNLRVLTDSRLANGRFDQTQPSFQHLSTYGSHVDNRLTIINSYLLTTNYSPPTPLLAL
jgi:hypothetical protein